MATLLRRHEPADVPADAEPVRKGRRWTLYGALGVVAALIVAAAYVGFTPSSGESTEQAYAGPVLSVPAAAPGVAAVGVCDFPPGPAEAVTIAPSDVTWALAGSMATPSSVSAGPLNRDPVTQVPGCYARSAQGALMAASNWVTTMQNPKVDKVQALQALVARTAGYDQMLAGFESINADYGTPDVPSVSQIAAFRMVFFDQSHAEIEIVSRATSGNSPGFMASVVYVLVWENDDWKIAPVLDGSAPITRTVDVIAPPYIPFNGA